MDAKGAPEVSTYALLRDGRKKVMATQVKIDGQEIRFSQRLDRAEAIRRATEQVAAR